MSKKFLTDAGVGRAMFATRIRLSLKAAEMCLFWGAVPIFFIVVLHWRWSTPVQDLAVVRLMLLSKLLPGDWLVRLHLQDAQGSPLPAAVAGSAHWARGRLGARGPGDADFCRRPSCRLARSAQDRHSRIRFSFCSDSKF